MNQQDKYLQSLYRRIAKTHNTTPEAVERDINAAIMHEWENASPEVKADMKRMSKCGDMPTAYEIITAAVRDITD